MGEHNLREMFFDHYDANDDEMHLLWLKGLPEPEDGPSKFVPRGRPVFPLKEHERASFWRD